MFKTGLILLLLSLFIAWMSALFRYLIKVDESKIQTQQMVKSHIDYLLMALLLILFSHYESQLSPLIKYAAIIGATTNPMLFLAMAFKPDISKEPLSVYGVLSVTSFLVTTIGFGGICVSLLL